MTSVDAEADTRNCCILIIKDIITLEAVQRRFTKRIPEIKHLTYYQRLSKLKLESLELRRLRTDLLFAYKLVFGMLDVKVADFFITDFSNAIRGHCYRLYLPLCKSSIGTAILTTELSVYGTICQRTLILHPMVRLSSH